VRLKVCKLGLASLGLGLVGLVLSLVSARTISNWVTPTLLPTIYPYPHPMPTPQHFTYNLARQHYNTGLPVLDTLST